MFHQPRQDQPRGADAHLDGASQAEVQRVIVAFEDIVEDGVRRVQEQRNAQLLGALVERPQPLVVDDPL